MLPICHEFNNSLDNTHPLKGASNMLIYDTSGVKPKVKENNPKFLNTEIKKFKTYA